MKGTIALGLQSKLGMLQFPLQDGSQGAEMTDTNPPKDYEDLIRLIHDRHDGMSKTYQRISVFLTQNPNEVAVHSVNAIADRCGIHASSFVRYAQSLGYKGFKELQVLYQKRLATAAPGFDARVQALKEQLSSISGEEGGTILGDFVAQDIAALQGLVADVNPTLVAEAAAILHKAKTIYIIGQLRSAAIADLLRYMLTMIGKPSVLLDPGGGLATHMARSIGQDDALLAVSFRYYANEVVSVVDSVGDRGIPVVSISDSTLSPLAKAATVLLAVPEREQKFTRSITAPICLAQALIVNVAALLQGAEVQPRVPSVTET